MFEDQYTRRSQRSLQHKSANTPPSKSTSQFQLQLPKTDSRNISSSKRFKLPGMSSSKFSPQAPKTPLIIRFYDPHVQAEDTRGRTLEQILSWSNSDLESCHNYIQMLFPLPEGSPFNFAAPVIDVEVMQAFYTRSELRNRLNQSFERMLNFYGFTISTKPGVNDDKTASQQQQSNEQDEERKEKQQTSSQQAIFTTKQTLDTPNPQDPPTTTVSPSQIATTLASLPPTNTYTIIPAPHFHRASSIWTRRFDHNHLRITRILRCLRVLGLQKECDAFFAALKRVYDDPSINISERSMMFWKRAVTRPLFVAPDGEEVEWLRGWEEREGGKRKREGEDERDE